MKPNRKKLKEFGYKEFFPLNIQEGKLQFFAVALKEQLPFVAVGKANGRATLPNNITLSTLPASIKYLVVEEKELYRRGDEQTTFSRCLSLPKADGTIWGQHSRADLLPLRNLGETIDYAKTLLKISTNEAIGLLLGLKLMDEASGKELLFRIPEDKIDEIESWLTSLSLAFGLEKEWKTASSPSKEELQEIVMAWQPYRFLSEVQTQGVFSLLSTLLVSDKRGELLVKDRVVYLIHALLAGCQEPICIAGANASPLLDISLLGTKNTKMIDKCSPLIAKLGQTLLQSFENIPEDFLHISQRERWPTLVCLPPFGQRIANDELLAEFELVDRGRGKRSKAVDAEILWLEKSHKLLAEEGFLAIILTDGFLSNASSSFAREWVQSYFQIDSVFSLPPSVFHPGTGVKTSLVCLRKMSKPPRNYRIFMAELEEKDLDDLSSIIQAYRLAKQEDGS